MAFSVYQKSVNSTFVINTDGERIPLTFLERKEKLDVEIKHHLELFHQYFYGINQSNFKSNIEKALWLGDASVAQTYKQKQSQGIYNRLLQYSLIQEVDTIYSQTKINTEPFPFVSVVRFSVTRGEATDYYELTTTGSIVTVESNYPYNPHGLLITNFFEKNLKQIREKIEKNKIIFFSVAGLITLFIGAYSLLVFGDGKKDNQLNQITVPTVDASKEQYQSKLEAVNAQKKKKTTHIPSVYDEIINSYDETDTELTQEDKQRIIDSIYKSGQIDYGIEPAVSTNNYIPSPNASSAKEKKLDPEETYRQELLQAKEEMLRHYEASQKRYQKEAKQQTKTMNKEIVTLRVSVYQNQYVLPGNRVKLVLNHDFAYNNQLFSKGTFIYGFVEMAPYRVFIAVNNIAHVPITLVAKDITDGNMGLYSTRAGELWAEYKDEFSNEVGDDVADVAKDVSNSSLVGSALKGLGNFFKKKKIRQRDKILLQNNDEIILTTPLK